MQSMAHPDTTQVISPHARLLVIFSALTLLAGAGGMATSFLFLASPDHDDFIGGVVGSLAGVILAVAGLLSLAVQSRSPTAGQAVTHVVMCLLAFLPPVVAFVVWSVLYFGAFLGVFLAGLFLIPGVPLACVAWAWYQSRAVAVHLSALLRWPDVPLLRAVVFVTQAVAILGALIMFSCSLELLGSFGYRVAWP